MSNTTRTFDYQDDKSSKFWEITQTDDTVTVRYGKTGTNGQSQDKTIADAAALAKHIAKLVAEKTAKSYVERGCVQPVQAASVDEPQVTADPADCGTPPSVRSQTKKTPTKTSQTSAKAVKPVNAAKPKNPAHNPEATPDSLLALLDKDDTTNRLLARHPRASAELLEKLSHSSDKATRQSVAGNPNTAPEIYVKLGQQFPTEFLANPALDLLLMVNPALMEEVPQALLIRLLKQADCPVSLLSWAAGHSQAKVQLAVTMNTKVPEEALAKLRASQHASVLEAVSAAQGNPDLAQDPEKAFEQALRDRLGSMKYWALQDAWSEGDIGLAQWSALPLEFRLAKATKGGPSSAALARALRDSGRTHEAVLQIFANHRAAFASATDTPVTVLEALAKDKDGEVRREVAKNPSTPVAVLEALARDNESDVRREVAKHPSTPVAVLEAQASDSESYVRESVAEHLATPVAVLEALAKDKERWVRAGVAKHPSTPVAVLEALAKDQEFSVREKVAKHPSTQVAVLEALARDKTNDVRREVAKHPSTPVAVLETLANDQDYAVRGRVAKNLSTRASVLEALAKDQDSSSVWREVAQNPSTPVVVLEALAKDTNNNVRAGVARNPSTPAQLKETLLEALAKEEGSWVRQEVADNPSTPVAVLEALAKDKDSDVRVRVARNPSTQAPVLERLAAGRSPVVAVAALENPNTPLPAVIKQLSSKTKAVRVALAAHAHRSPEIWRTLWRDADQAVRLAVLQCPQLTQDMLNEIVQSVEHEAELATLLEHPNLSAQRVASIADKLFDTPATASAWYRQELSGASAEVAAAASAQAVLSYFGKDPNKVVLAKRPLAPVMALCSGPFVEPSCIVKVAGSTDWLVRAAVAHNTGTPPNLIKKLTADPHPLVAALAHTAQAGPAEPTPQTADAPAAGLDMNRAVAEVLERLRNTRLLHRLVTDAVWSDHASIVDVVEATASSGLLSPSQATLQADQLALVYAVGAKLTDPALRRKFAENPHCPVDVISVLVRDEDPYVVLAALRHPAFPKDEHPHVLQRLLKLRGTKLLDVLQCPHVPLAVLEAKASSNDRNVREKVAAHPSTPTVVLDALAKDQDRDVRWKVALNPSTPLSLKARVLEVLAKDKEGYVRLRVAENPSTPVTVLETLAKDEDGEVRDGVARNPFASVALLEALAKDKERWVRVGVAQNPSAPLSLKVSLLEALAKDKESSVRRAVAKHTSTPKGALEALVKDADYGVREAAISRISARAPDVAPASPPVPTAAPEKPTKHWSALALQRAAVREASLRTGQALAPQVPVAPGNLLRALQWLQCLDLDADNQALTKASRSKDWLTRLGVALHPSVTEGILKILRKDSDPDVAKAASSRAAGVAINRPIA